MIRQYEDFITADFLYMFRASCVHHQECKILTRQPPVHVVMVAGGSSLRHIGDRTIKLRSRFWNSNYVPLAQSLDFQSTESIFVLRQNVSYFKINAIALTSFLWIVLDVKEILL